MANTIYNRVLVERFGSCHYPASARDCNYQKVIRFVSNADALPGYYYFNMTTPNGVTHVVIMLIGSGGGITYVETPNSLEPVWYAGGLQPSVVGIGTHEVVVTYGVQSTQNFYAPYVTVTAPPNCNGSFWTEQTLTDYTVFNDYEVPISKPSGANMGVAIVSPGQYTVKGFKGLGSYQGDWVGGGIAPPGSQLGVVTFSFFPVNAAGQPLIPEEDKVQVPVKFTNGSGVPIRICIDGVCTDLDDGEDLPFDWRTYVGDRVPDVVITYPGCPLCPPVFPVWPEWDPSDPNDPTNCTPAPGVTCPVFQIYVPPPITTPDPEPEPEPEPEGGSGNEGNFQGCIANPCEIPYLYTYESK